MPAVSASRPSSTASRAPRNIILPHEAGKDEIKSGKLGKKLTEFEKLDGFLRENDAFIEKWKKHDADQNVKAAKMELASL